MNGGWINGRCAVCEGRCDGTLMRTHPAYSRVRDMLKGPDMPHMKNGGLALCHICQRRVYWAGGIVPLMASRLNQVATTGAFYKFAK